jgi:hypothetical protein
MKRIKAALAAGALLVAGAGTAAVVSAGSASAEMSGYEKVTASDTVPGGSGTYTVTASCTSGKSVVGGGYDVDSTKFLILTTRIVTNKPTGSNNGWTVTFTETDGAGDKNLGVVVSAVCATP